MPSKLNIGPEIKYKGTQCNDSPALLNGPSTKNAWKF